MVTVSGVKRLMEESQIYVHHNLHSVKQDRVLIGIYPAHGMLQFS